MRCPSCGAPANARWDHCRVCGAEFPKPRMALPSWRTPSLSGVRMAFAAPRLSLGRPAPSGPLLERLRQVRVSSVALGMLSAALTAALVVTLAYAMREHSAA